MTTSRTGFPRMGCGAVSGHAGDGVLQYAENLTDRQATQAVRCRIDWKYCLARE